MGERAFQLKEQVVLSIWVTKVKKEELEGGRGSITEDRVSKRIKKRLFRGILIG